MTVTLARPPDNSVAPPTASDEARIRPKSWRLDDVAVLAGAALSSFCLIWVVYFHLTPLEGAPGFILSWYVLFLATYWLMIRNRATRLAAKDRIMAVVMATAVSCLLVPVVLVIGYTAMRGYHALRPAFFTQTQEFVSSLSPPTEGGALHAIVGTVEQVGLAILFSVPLGFCTAIFLNEVGGRLARPVRTVVDALSATPSIVCGLFIYAVWVTQGNPKHGFSGLAAALALSVLMLPTVTRTAEVVLRLVPGGLREASLALGGSNWRTTLRVVLPTARSGLITAVILGVARSIGETASLLLTAGGAFTVNANPLHGNQESLPLYIYRLQSFARPSQVARAWTGALVLIVIVLVLFTVARIVGNRGPGRRRARAPVARQKESIA
jgi:phosphate transport system permease protein